MHNIVEPQKELAVGNIIRRVLNVIREEYSAISYTDVPPESLRSSHLPYGGASSAGIVPGNKQDRYISDSVGKHLPQFAVASSMFNLMGDLWCKRSTILVEATISFSIL